MTYVKSRAVRLLIAMCLALAGLGTVAAVPAQASGEHGGVGRPVSVEELPHELWLPGTGRAYRVRYTSTGVDGTVVIVSGALFVPAGPVSKPGWPVVAWAHGTVGVADPCAPSTAGRSERDITYLSAWLKAGYAVVAIDYEGLGSDGEHPYINGISEAKSVIDMVRAGRIVDPSLTGRWLAVGQSQGAQGALFTDALIDHYAPELDFRGAIATGLPSQWRTTAEAADVFDPAAAANPFVLMLIAGLNVTHPDVVRPGEYLTDFGQALFARARSTHCFSDLVPHFAGQRVADVYAMDAAEQERLLRLLDAHAEIPIARYREPVFIAQGTEDRVVYPPASKTTADLLDAAGTDVTFRFYPGADHNTTLEVALPDLLVWAADQMR